MTTLGVALVSASLFIFCCVVFLFSLCRASSQPTPERVPTKDQVIWMKAAAKVAHRRAS